MVDRREGEDAKAAIEVSLGDVMWPMAIFKTVQSFYGVIPLRMKLNFI